MTTRARIITRQKQLADLDKQIQVLYADMCADDLAAEALDLGHAMIKVRKVQRALQDALAATDLSAGLASLTRRCKAHHFHTSACGGKPEGSK